MVKSTIIHKKESHGFASKQSMKNLLFTPVRKLLRTKVKPMVSLLGKRPRKEEYQYSDPVDPVVDTPPPPTPFPASPMPFTSSPTPQANVHASHKTRSIPPTPPIRVALENTDPDNTDPTFSDTVIITTLDNIPFCCHEDLLTMSRSQLVEVAKQLNEKLPRVMRIEVDDDDNDAKSEFELRKEIEEIVGLSTEGKIVSASTPGAPKVDERLVSRTSLVSTTATASEDDEDEDEDSLFFSPPTSPLARRSRPSEALLTPKLARLVEEEDEDSPMVIETRPTKRRRVLSDVQMDDVNNNSPTPKPRVMTRTRSHYTKKDSPMPKAKSGMDLRFVTTSRPTYRSLRRGMIEAVVASSPHGRSSPLGEEGSGVVSMETD